MCTDDTPYSLCDVEATVSRRYMAGPVGNVAAPLNAKSTTDDDGQANEGG